MRISREKYQNSHNLRWVYSHKELPDTPPNMGEKSFIALMGDFYLIANTLLYHDFLTFEEYDRYCGEAEECLKEENSRKTLRAWLENFYQGYL